MAISLSLLIAFMYCYLQEIFSQLPTEGPFRWFLFASVKRSCGLGGKNDADDQAHTSFPDPDPWHWSPPPEYTPPDPSFAWPVASDLFLYCRIESAVVMITMWFYVLHLKLFGHT